MGNVCVNCHINKTCYVYQELLMLLDIKDISISSLTSDSNLDVVTVGMFLAFLIIFG